jgi:hypothetical protein
MRIGKEIQAATRSIVQLKLGSGVKRSFVLTQVRPRTKAGNRIGLMFPVPVVRALNPLCDHAAIAAAEYGASDFMCSTTHPEIPAVRSRLPKDQDDAFTDSLPSYLNGLCRRVSGSSGDTTATIGLSTESVRACGANAMKAMPPTAPRVAPPTLNAIAPVPQDRRARSRWNCTASPALISGVARRIESLSAVALPDSGDKGGRQRWRCVFKPKRCAP